MNEADIIQVNDDFLKALYPNYKKEDRLENLQKEYPNLNIVYLRDTSATFKSNAVSKDSINITRQFKSVSDSNSYVFTGSFLARLHAVEAFGNELSDPIFVVNEKMICDALDVAISEIDS